MKKASAIVLASMYVVAAHAADSVRVAGPAKAQQTRGVSKTQKLSKSQLASITAGKITQVNGGGQTPQGNANGIPATNPAGNAPPGQNK